MAALLCSRSSKDGQAKNGHNRPAHGWLPTFRSDFADLFLTPFSSSLCAGSTFLQRFYRIHCAFHTPGFVDHRPRLLRLIELHGAFHTSARNDAGQTLLHTLCSRETYQVRRSVRRRLPNGSVVFDEVRDCTAVNNRSKHLAGQLCRLLQRAGADFNSPDNNGQQSAVADQRSSSCIDNALA